MNRQQNPNNKFYGLHFDDPWKEWIKGFKKREETIKDITKLSNEVLNYRNELFPLRSIPLETHPGYVTHSQNFFRVKTRNSKLSQKLTDYFVNENRYRDNGPSYGNMHDLGGFFELVLHSILLDGVSYYAIEWGKTKLGTKEYNLPTGFLYINPSTIKLNKSSGGAYQKFSFISKFINDYYEYRNTKFEADELIIFKHPTLFPSSPVKMSMKYIKDLRQWMTFSLWQGKGNAEPTNYSLRVATTRYKHQDDFFKKSSTTRVKVRRIFKQSIGGQKIGVTTYYEVFAFAEYKKHLNILRDSLVDEFNKQILTLVQSKNNVKSPITLEYKGFANNEVIDQALKNYQEGTMDVNAFIEAIKDDYNKKLF